MGVYYNFYLDKNIGDDKWLSIIVDDTDIIYYMRSRHWLYDEYSVGLPLNFKYLSQDYQEKNFERYNSLSDSEKAYCFNFYEMDLDRMKTDYDNDIHVHAGIISKNSYYFSFVVSDGIVDTVTYELGNRAKRFETAVLRDFGIRRIEGFIDSKISVVKF